MGEDFYSYFEVTSEIKSHYDYYANILARIRLSIDLLTPEYTQLINAFIDVWIS